MVVQHNLTAMNSNRMLGITQNLQAKSSEKLSSGYRINRAADDAAGLSISEKMRKQINGLDKASSNAQDGVSAVQTAEGALTEVHSMLQRMNELAVQASNGTNSEDDRAAIQAEIDQLVTEIDRVAETTKFNETYLLRGGNGTKKINLEAHDAGLKGTLKNNGNGKATFTMDALEAGDSVSIGGRNYTIIKEAQTEAVADEDYTFTAKKGASFTINMEDWTNDANSEIKIEVNGDTTPDVTVNTAADVDAVITALETETDFTDNYTASKTEEGNLVITAKDNTVSLDDLKAQFTIKIDSNPIAANDLEGTENVETSTLEVAEGVKLYAEGGDKELTVEEAIAELEAGKKVYVDEAPDFGQTAAVDGTDYTYNAETNAYVDLDLSGWTGNGNDDVIQIGDMAAGIAGATTNADLENLVEALNNAEGFKDLYKAELISEDEGIVRITALDHAVTAEEIEEALVSVKVGGTESNTGYAGKAVEPAEASVTGVTGKLYAAGGEKALTNEEILAALEKGETLYTDAAQREEYELTKNEAYTKIQEELLKANQIGDTLGTAKVVFAAGAEVEEVDADDFEVGDVKEIGDTEYTVGMSVDDFLAEVDKLEAAAKAGSDQTAITISFENEDGVQEWTITPDSNTNTASAFTQTKVNGSVPGTADNPADINELKEALKAGAGYKFTIAGGASVNGTDEFAGEYFVAGDDVTGATVISAEKMAELVNEANAPAEEVPGSVFEITTGSAEVAKTLSFNLHVGADADMTNKIQVGVEAMSADYLGIKNLNVKDDTGLAATYAVDAIQDAIQKVSSQRSALGAVQNRLEHTIANLDNVVENTTAAESRIRDTDMAQEMVEYSKNNILAQAGQSMLAQANQSTQGVLSLLG